MLLAVSVDEVWECHSQRQEWPDQVSLLTLRYQTNHMKGMISRKPYQSRCALSIRRFVQLVSPGIVAVTRSGVSATGHREVCPHT
jgi:hypothetical protein